MRHFVNIQQSPVDAMRADLDYDLALTYAIDAREYIPAGYMHCCPLRYVSSPYVGQCER